MLRAIVWKEFVGHLLTVRFLACLLLCVTLVLTSLSVLLLQYGSLQTRTHQEQRRSYSEMHGASADEIRWRGFTVSRASPPLRVFHVGLDDAVSRSVWTSMFWGQRYQSELSANPMFLLFPVLDTTYVVGVVMSLMAFVLCYDAVSGELEQGTLSLTLSFPVPRDLLLAGKWLGAVAAATLPLAVTVLAAVILVVGFTGIDLAATDWAALAAAFATALLYIGLSCALALWISALVRRSATSIALLLLVWVLMAVVIPNLSPYVAEWIAPIPTVQSVETEKQQVRRAVMDEFFARFRDLRRIRDRAERDRRMRELERELTERITGEQRAIETSFQRQLDGQTRWAQAISRLSPYASFVYAVTALSETGIERRRLFFEAVERNETLVTRYLAEVKRANEEKGVRGWEDGAERIEGRALPRFDVPRRPLAERAADASVDALHLALGTILFGLLAHRRFVTLQLQ